MQPILIAFIGTLMIFIGRQVYGLYRQFRYFEIIRKTVIYATFSYLRTTPLKMLDIVRLREHLYTTLEKKKLTRFLNRLQVNWVNRDEIMLSFQLGLGWLRPAYSFKVKTEDLAELFEGRVS